MTKEEKLKQRSLNQELTEVCAKFSIAQSDLEKVIEEFGMSSTQAVVASQRCSDLALRYSELDDEIFMLRNHAWRYKTPPS